MTPSALIALVGMQTKSSLEFGISLPTIGMGSPSAIKIVAEQAESAGLDSVWAADHIVLPTGTSSYYPYDTEGQFLIASQLPFSAAASENALCAMTLPMEYPWRSGVLFGLNSSG